MVWGARGKGGETSDSEAGDYDRRARRNGPTRETFGLAVTPEQVLARIEFVRRDEIVGETNGGSGVGML